MSDRRALMRGDKLGGYFIIPGKREVEQHNGGGGEETDVQSKQY